MTYNPPPQYNFGDAGSPQSQPPAYGPQPQSVPPSYSPQPPTEPAYAPQPPVQPTVPVQVQPGAMTGAMVQPVMAGPGRPGRGPVVPLLAVATAVGFAVAAIMVAMWLRSSGDLDDATAKVDDRDSQIAQLQEDLEAAEENLAAAETQVGDLETQIEDAAAMEQCLDDLQWFYSTEVGSAEEAEAQVAVNASCSTYIF